ncbi:MAG: hypothetical protein FJX67_16010 [Alphaproteobacteria bacterium]|nr:hypothetical protein [Alphaproteobacteria bacterium]
MPTLGKPQLRSLWRRLAAVAPPGADGADAREATQERLDFLALLAGIKPVYLLGRGYGHGPWREAVLATARDLGLHVVAGPFWTAAASEGAWPDWYADHVRAETAGGRAWYIARARAVADEVAAIGATGRPTIEQEARLLGYPPCCVRAHYARARAFHDLWLAMLAREAGGEPARMQAILAEGRWIEPATEAERAALDRALALEAAPFTPVDMCASCVADAASPALRLSARYAALLETLELGRLGRAGRPGRR